MICKEQNKFKNYTQKCKVKGKITYKWKILKPTWSKKTGYFQRPDNQIDTRLQLVIDVKTKEIKESFKLQGRRSHFLEKRVCYLVSHRFFGKNQ